MRKIDPRLCWIAAALFAVLLRVVASADMIERIYSRGFFKIVRTIVDYTVGLLPFPTVYLWVLGLLFWLIIKVRRFAKWEANWKQKAGSFALSLGAFLSGVGLLFLVLWGYNYGRPSIERMLDFQVKKLSPNELLAEYETVSKELIQFRATIPNVTDNALTINELPANLENKVRHHLTTWLSKNNFPTPGKVRGRLLRPKGVLLRFSTAGIYLPWVGEGHIDAGMHPIQYPFVMCHEMAHGYGFTEEGTCNFIAYLACTQSDDPFIQYSGALNYWYYLDRAVRTTKKIADKSAEMRANLPPQFQKDRAIISAYSNRYPDVMPALRDVAYDQYLKSQGISEGLKSYSRVVLLMRGYREEMIEKQSRTIDLRKMGNNNH